MNINENVQTLADSMNVSFNDVFNLARMVSGTMIQDGITEDHMNTPELKFEIVEAYLMDSKRKMQSFTNKYLSNPEARELLNEKILIEIKQESNT